MKIAIDTETELITETNLTPRLVCMSVAVDDHVMLFDRHQSVQMFEGILSTDATIIGHNIAYDFGVLCAAGLSYDKVFEAYESGRIVDTKIKAKLDDIARGIYRSVKYDLAACCQRYLDLHVAKQDTWRLRYGELYDTPIEQWPTDAREYALNDARVTLALEAAIHDLPDVTRQTAYEWWLHLTSVRGIATDGPRVQRMLTELTQEAEGLVDLLCVNGLLEPNMTRNTKAVQRRIAAALGSKAKKTPTGKVQTSAEACEATGDPVLQAYARFGQILNVLGKDADYLTKPEIHARFDLAESGRSTCSKPNLQNIRRGMGMRECFVPRPGYVFAIADYNTLELCSLAQVCYSWLGHSVLRDTINAGKDPHTMVAAQILGTDYDTALTRVKDSTDQEAFNARQCGKVCFHPDTEVLTRRGWVKFPDLSANEQVCSANVLDNGQVELHWEVPLALTQRHFSGKLVHLKNEGIDLRVTPDHRMVGWRGNGKAFTTTPEKFNLVRYFPNAGELQNDTDMPADFVKLLRLAVAVQADGSYYTNSVKLGFTKQRKIDRLKSMLEPEEYRLSVNGKIAVTWFHLTQELSKKVKALLTEDKGIPLWWTELPLVCRKVILDELKYWDGTTNGKRLGFSYCSVVKSNVDNLQAIATLTGYKTSIRVQYRENPLHQTAYNLNVKPRNKSRGENVKTTLLNYDDIVYCLTTRNDTIVVRDKGKPVITRQCNFGFPGGLGPNKLVLFAHAGYGVTLTETRAQDLRITWLNTYPEMSEFFKAVDKRDEPITQLFSGRFRGGCYFTSACNTLFQGLGADITKCAGFAISKACYTDKSSPLYGSHIVNFEHDAFILEVPALMGHEAAMEMQRIMVETPKVFCPDVILRAEPALSKRWSKNVKPIFENGRLVPWDMT
jgi:DNA polymerase I-like protein with 3'-5' exonuclease and polymerase domains